MYLLALLVVLWQLHEKHTDGGGWKLNDDDDEPAPLRTFIVTASATVSAAATPVVDTRQNRIGSRSRSSSRVNDNGIIIQSSSHIIMTCIMHGISMRDRIVQSKVEVHLFCIEEKNTFWHSCILCFGVVPPPNDRGRE